MSNLLEKASIVTTPTAYDNGKILSVKPAPSLGSELVVNGDFATDSNWNLGSGWSIGDGVAVSDGSSGYSFLQQTSSVLNGKTYKVSYSVTSYTSGSVEVGVGGASNNNIQRNSVGDFVEYHTSNGTNLTIISRNFIGSIDNVSVKEVIDGDFDFTRNSSATRVNSQGLIEDVQILSSNLVSNGDFSQEGSELVTNGDFATDLSGWSYPVSGVTWDNGKAQIDALDGAFKYIQQIITTSGTKSYKISFDVSNIQGVIQLIISNNLVTEKSTNGSFEVYYTTSATNPTIQFKRKSGTNTFFELDNVSVKEVGQDWTLGTGWSIGASVATVDNTVNANLDQFISGFSGKKVRVSFEISDLSSGGILVGDIVNPGAYNATSNGIHTFDYTATNSTFRVRAYGNPCSITNISVVEITDDTNLPRINYEGFSYQDALGSELVVNGGFDTDSDWTKQTSWSISGGAANYDFLSDAKYIRQTLLSGGFVAGKVYKINFDITSGTAYMNVSSNGGGLISLNTYSVGSYSIQVTASASGSDLLIYGRNTSGTAFSIDNVSVKEYLGQEVVPDSGYGSWLFEPQSTNLIPYSEDFTQWNKSNASLINTISSTVVSPDGVSYANKLYPIGSATSSFIIQGGSGNCFSVFVKKGERRWVLIYGGFSNSNVWFDSENGVFGNIFDNVVTVESFGNDWYRIKILWAQNSSHVRIYNTDSGTSTQSTGNGTDGLYIWGAQLEVQSFATSYIPTNGAISTRLQDAAFGAGSSDLINSTEGVLYWEGVYFGASGNNLISVSESGSNNYVALFFLSGSTILSRYYNNGSIQGNTNYGGLNTTDYFKIAFSWSQDNFSLWVNGVRRSLDTSGNIITPNVFNKINFASVSNSQNFFGKTKCLAVFKEALTDEELTCLTTI